MTVKLYHPSHGGVWEGPEASAEVLAESGWLPVPEPEARPGYQPEPVTFAPVVGEDEPEPEPEPPAKAKRATKSSQTDDTAGEDTDT